MLHCIDSKTREVDKNSAPWLSHYPFCIPAHLDYPEQPVSWLLEQAAQQFPHRIATRYYNESQTYSELYDRAARAAELFRSLGVKPGDRVGVLLPNIPEYLISVFGIWMAGGVVVSLSPLSVAPEIDDLLRATDCKTVVALDLLAPLATKGEHRPQHLLTCSIAHRLPPLERLMYMAARMARRGLHFSHPYESGYLMDRLTEFAPIHKPVPADTHSPALILPTGGTTGRPKAVTLSHANLLANALQLKAWCGDRRGRDTMLSVIPFFHSYGLSTCLTAGVAMAATLVLHHRFNPDVTLKLIETTRPSVFPTVPAMLHVLNQHIAKSKVKHDTRSLMWVISGGAPLKAEIADAFSKNTGANVVEGFGLSECSPVTHAGPLDGTARTGTIGLPLPDTDALIVDPENGTDIMEPGEVGELIIRGPQVMLGYWNDPEATAHTIRDGWLYTGDLASCDADGFFRIVDRKKDLIITSGFNVYPSDVEAILKQFPQVKDAAVVGVPDLQRGEIVKAIVAVEDTGLFEQRKFENYIKENLAHHKAPKIIEYVHGDLPRNFLGKVLRRKLRDEAPEREQVAVEASEQLILGES